MCFVFSEQNQGSVFDMLVFIRQLLSALDAEKELSLSWLMNCTEINMIASAGYKLMKKFGCIVLLDQIDKRCRETICTFGSGAVQVMLKSVICSSVPTSASKSTDLSVHSALPIAVEMLSSTCKRISKIRKSHLDFICSPEGVTKTLPGHVRSSPLVLHLYN